MTSAHLKLRRKVTLTTTSPFHFVGTVHKPSHFPGPLSYFDGKTYWCSMLFEGRTFGLRLSAHGKKQPKIIMSVYAARPVGTEQASRLAREVEYRFGMKICLDGFESIARKDPLLRPVFRRWRGMRPSCAFSLYELLCITIVLQNTQVSRSVKMLATLLSTYGTAIQFSGRKLYAFWPPEQLANEQEANLRALKVGYRAKAFKRVSEFFLGHSHFEHKLRTMGKEPAASLLKDIYGVGPATAWYLSFESLKHLDAFDHVSPWEQKILSRLLFGKEMVAAGHILSEARKRWGNWRMLAVHYIFEDGFWMRKRGKASWLDALIRL